MADLHIPFCSIETLDTSSFCYLVCRTCEEVVADGMQPAAASGTQNCRRCRQALVQHGVANTKRLYKLLLSVGTQDKVLMVVAFDRAARVLMGCSADEFYSLVSRNPSAVETASRLLYGEMVELVLRKSRKGNAQHLRAVTVVPLSSRFQPVMATMLSS